VESGISIIGQFVERLIDQILTETGNYISIRGRIQKEELIFANETN